MIRILTEVIMTREPHSTTILESQSGWSDCTPQEHRKGGTGNGLGLVRSCEDMILELRPEAWEVCGVQEV